MRDQGLQSAPLCRLPQAWLLFVTVTGRIQGYCRAGGCQGRRQVGWGLRTA